MAVFRLRKSGGGSALRGGDGLQTEIQILAGVLFTRPPTFIAGSLALEIQDLVGVLFLRPPTFIVGILSLQVQLPPTGLRDMGVGDRTYTVGGSRSYSGN